MSFKYRQSFGRNIILNIRRSARPPEVLFSNSPCTFNSEADAEMQDKLNFTKAPVSRGSETSTPKVRPNLRPISFLGLGSPRTVRSWRHHLLKEFEEKQEEDDCVPSILKIMYKKAPDRVNELYPVAYRRLQYVEQLSKLKSLPKEEAPIQYPFQKKSEKFHLTTAFSENKNHALLSKEGEPIDSLTSTFNSFVKHVEDSPVKVKNFQPQDNLNDLRHDLWKFNYGTAKSNVPASSMPCGGCGAFLHCQDTAIPGFMPSERFVGLSRKNLAKEICQRCLFLQQFNVALNVSVSSEDYPKILSEIKNKVAIVLLIVDLTDFPCSIWPGIIDVIGPKRPIVVVGNKLDLLPQDDEGFLGRIKASLKQNLKDSGIDMGSNVRYVGLISAKTGYGVEELITELQNLYKIEGDVYIVGCTNVGKSTLFNALLQSDYCRVQSADLIQRATTSVWPGTTLNLLRFPILRPTGWRLYERAQRLKREAAAQKEREMMHHMNSNKDRSPVVSIIGRIGTTFRDEGNADAVPFSRPPDAKPFIPDHPNMKYHHCCYDTPGAVYEDQILELLTIEELIKTIPRQRIIPRTFILKPEQTLFLGGLGRIDCIEGPRRPIYVTVFASVHLPVHIVYTEISELFYQQNLGTAILEVPSGGSKRLKDFPPLEGRTVQLRGMWNEQSTADVVLSSAGWVSITIAKEQECTFKMYTPGGRGCHVRQPPLVPFAVKMRGKRIKGTPAYEVKL